MRLRKLVVLSVLSLGVLSASVPSFVYADKVVVDDLVVGDLGIGVQSNIVVPITDDFLNIRSESNSSSQILGRLLPNSYAEILDEDIDSDSDWIKVKSGDIEGYVYAPYTIRDNDLSKAVNSNPNAYDLRVSFNSVQGGYTTKKDAKDDIFLYDTLIKLKKGTTLYNSCSAKDVREDIVEKVSYAVSLEDGARVRAEKNDEDDSNVLLIADKGEEMRILSFEDKWVHVKYKGYEGYINENLVDVGLRNKGVSNVANEDSIKSEKLYTIIGKQNNMFCIQDGDQYYWVRCKDVELKCKPNATSSAKLAVEVNKSFDVVEYCKDYIKIKYEDKNYFVKNENCYVYAVFDEAEKVEIPDTDTFTPIRGDSGGSTRLYKYNYKDGTEDATEQRDEIVKFALKYLGNPYVWGGTSLEHGADCSGFCQSVLGHFDINIGRSTSIQVGESKGKIIKAKDMKPGDLIYYTRNGVTPYHVVMYIGDGKCVNASCKAYGICVSNVKYSSILEVKNYID